MKTTTTTIVRARARATAATAALATAALAYTDATRRAACTAEGRAALASRDADLRAVGAGSRGAPAARREIMRRCASAIEAPIAPEAAAHAAANAAADRATARVATLLADPRVAAAVAGATAVFIGIRHDEIEICVGEPGAWVTTWEDRDRYSGGWHRQYGTATRHSLTVHVPLEWCARVQDPGLARVGGLPTLDAEPIEAPAGYTAWSAIWLEQGRGYGVTLRTGVIVREVGRDGEYAHGTTVAGAVRTLRTRARAQWVARRAATVDLTDHLAARVTLADSARAGNCSSGTRGWCARAGLDPSMGAPVGEVLAALAAGAGEDRLALAACRHAVARQIAATDGRVAL